MAIETAPRRETVAVEPPVLASVRPLRLHEEILPPKLVPPTAATLRRAKRAIAILALVVVALQPISVPLGHLFNAETKAGTDVNSVWQRYLSAPVPDVLVIGASAARTDIEEATLSALLSKAVGHSVTVEKMGFNGQGPRFFDVLMYRVMKRPSHPKLIVIALLPPILNDGCIPCLLSVNAGIWDVTDLTDPGYLKLALDVSPDPGKLAAGWALPALAYYPSVAAVQCFTYEYAKAGALAILGRVPPQIHDPGICGATAVNKWANEPAMDPLDYDRSIQTYGGLMHDFQISSTTIASLRDTVTRAQTGGTTVVFMRTPLHSALRSLFPEDEATYERQLSLLASSLNVQVVDFHDAIPDNRALWVDTIHLNRAGAIYFATKLVPVLKPFLPAE